MAGALRLVVGRPSYLDGSFIQQFAMRGRISVTACDQIINGTTFLIFGVRPEAEIH